MNRIYSFGATFLLFVCCWLTAAGQEFVVPASGTQTITTCSGTIYDPGGEGNYPDNCDGYIVIYPENEDGAVHLEGDFDTEECCDHLRIYDGAGIQGTLLAQYDGTGHISISSISGSLTLQFISNFSEITGTYGTFGDPYATAGIVDYGYGSSASRHTLHYWSEPDPRTGNLLMTVPPCESYSVRLGNWRYMGEAESISYDWRVDTTEAAILLLKYAAVLQNPHHTPSEQPRFDFEILDENANLIDPECGYASFIANADLGWNVYYGILWKDWTLVGFDVSAYHGQTIRLRMTTYDCSAGAHYGYAYFILNCQRKHISASNCGGAVVNTFTAPAGFNYSWYYADNPESVVSTEQSVTVNTNVDRDLYCHISSIGNPNCCFDLRPPFGSRYPVADFTVEADSCGLTCMFHNASTVIYDGESPGTENEPCETAHWDFGDGTTSIAYNPTHTFPGPGTYWVTLISGISNDACQDTVSMSVVVYDNCGPAYPDNVEAVDCTIDAFQQPWDAQVLYSTSDIHCYYVPLVGDIDGDGNVEIVAGKTVTNDHYTTQLGIYRGADLQQIGTINLPQRIFAGFAGPIALVRYPDGIGGLQGAIVLHCLDNTLRSYNIDGQLLAASDVSTPCEGAISVADFNGDGWPEIYIGNAVYDAATLRLLCSGPTTGNMGRSWRCSDTERGHIAMSFAANILGDDVPELICGNTIYSVNIASRTNVSQNSVTLLKTIAIPARIPQDGNVAVADFNLDGQLDVLVTVDGTPNVVLDSSYFYAYDPDSESILFVHGHLARTVGYPFVGDIDGDGRLEFVYIDYQSSVSNSRITAMGYEPVAGLRTKWQATHTDESGQTSMTLFDFNQDGIMEIVYRDQDRLRIINGSGRSHRTGNDTVPFYDLYSVSMTAGTWNDYPVVADVNNDGRAEIVACGRMTTGLGYVGGQLAVVGGIHPWAPARKVWNQYMYNVTNINEDLTVPSPLFNNATVFTDPDNVVRRPFNNFLQQATTIDLYGRPFIAVPDVALEEANTPQFIGNDTLVFTISYCNRGDNTLNAPYPITFFVDSYGGDTLCKVLMSESLPADSCATFEIRLPKSMLCNIPSLDNLVAAVNCAGAGIAQNGGLQFECDTTNNVAAVPVVMQPVTSLVEVIACDSCIWDGVTYYESGDYTQTFTSDAGCDSVVTLCLTVYHSASEQVETTVCESDLPYRWNGVLFAGEGTQTAVLQTSHGCDSIVTMTLNSVDGNLQVVQLAGDLCEDFSVELLAQAEMSNFLWSTGETTPQITVNQGGTYFVTVSDGNCVSAGMVSIPSCDCQLYLPNAITPTDVNGINDYFSVPLFSQGQIREFKIEIYSRWGELVFRSDDKNFRWHGDVNGKVKTENIYSYVIFWTNSTGKKCSVTGIVTVF